MSSFSLAQGLFVFVTPPPRQRASSARTIRLKREHRSNALIPEKFRSIGSYARCLELSRAGRETIGEYSQEDSRRAASSCTRSFRVNKVERADPRNERARDHSRKTWLLRSNPSLFTRYGIREYGIELRALHGDS